MNKLIFIALASILLLGGINLFTQNGDEELAIQYNNFIKEYEELIDTENEDYLHDFLVNHGALENFEEIIQDNMEEIEQEEDFEQDTEKLTLFGSKKLKISAVKKVFKNVCLGGNDPKYLSEKQKLELFIEGKCSPIVIQPGILGSKLQVEIDCETLQKENPQIFEDCGWQTCDKKWYSIKKKAPKSEYTLWVPNLFGDLNAVKIGTSKGSMCMGHMFSLAREIDHSSGTTTYKPQKGIKVSVSGITPDTLEKGDCGVSGITNLADNFTLNKVAGILKGFRYLVETLREMGYQSGISFQSLPYDYRYEVSKSRTTQVLEKSLKSLKKFTGKKSVILGHSYANQNIFYALSQYTQEFKDSHINQWIPTGGPIIGAPKVANVLINKSNTEMIKQFTQIFGAEVSAGIKYQNQKLIVESLSSSFDLVIKDPFSNEKLQGSAWMKEVKDRIAYDAGKQNFDEVPLSYLPKKGEVCRPSIDKEKETSPLCNQNIVDFSKETLIEVEKEKFGFSKQDMTRLFNKYAPEDMSFQYKNYETNVFEDLVNPGVKVTVVYGNSLPTDMSYKYNEDPRIRTKKNKFIFPEETKFTTGDGTVTTTSAILGPLKWQHEHRNGVENAKPVQLVEQCSSFNPITNSNSVVDSETGELTFETSGYNGLECNCQVDDKYDKCGHGTMMGDVQFVQFIANTLITNAPSDHIFIPSEFTNEYLEDIMYTCPNLLE